MIYKNKRSEFEIIHSILYGASEGIKKTPLMYKSNLCPTHFVGYIDFLIEKDLIIIENHNPSGNIYYTTEKGKGALDQIETVLNQMK